VDGALKKGDLYYLSNPDYSSRILIAEGHGYLWLYDGVAYYFKSVATGSGAYFFSAEMTPLEKTDETLVR